MMDHEIILHRHNLRLHVGRLGIILSSLRRLAYVIRLLTCRAYEAPNFDDLCWYRPFSPHRGMGCFQL